MGLIDLANILYRDTVVEDLALLAGRLSIESSIELEFISNTCLNNLRLILFKMSIEMPL